MPDNYCFICGHYLADAFVLNNKNKRFYIGDHTENNNYSKSSVELPDKPVIHTYNADSEILFHSECFDILAKRCKKVWFRKYIHLWMLFDTEYVFDKYEFNDDNIKKDLTNFTKETYLSYIEEIKPYVYKIGLQILSKI